MMSSSKPPPRSIEAIVAAVSIAAVILSSGMFVLQLDRTASIASGALYLITAVLIGASFSLAIGVALARRRIATIFLSYSASDTAFAERLASDLRRSGFPVTTATSSLRVGDDITERIADIIAQSDFFLPIFSKQSISSPWTSKELQAALAGGKKVFPAVIEEVTPPEPLSNVKYADFTRDYTSAFALLAKSLKETAGEHKATSN
jgi:hypothetical protein